MADIEIKRGYEVLPDNNVRFGIRVINNSDSAILDVEVILDYCESLFELEGNKIQKLGTIPPTVRRTAKFILKPLSCIHKEEIGATVLYKDHTWKKYTQEMRPKEVHCVYPFLKEKSITWADFLTLSNAGYLEERGVNFEGITVDKMVDFLSRTCKNRLYKVDEFPVGNGKIFYLAGDAQGEKAYYLLTAVVKEYEELAQVLLRANSDKSYGLNGFLNEILDNLRHLSAMMNQNLVIRHGMIQTQEARLMMLVRKSPIHGDYMTCMGMSGNGCRIYITIAITVRPRMEVHGKEVAPTGLFGAVAGTPAPGSAVQRFAASTNRATATATSAFAF